MAISIRIPAGAAAARETANVQIQNMGTVAGNLCNAAPSADNAPTLLAMNAEVVINGAKGERRLPLDQFFKGPGANALDAGEILTAILVPAPDSGSGRNSNRGRASASGATALSPAGCLTGSRPSTLFPLPK